MALVDRYNAFLVGVSVDGTRALRDACRRTCGRCGICSVQYVVKADGGTCPCDFFRLGEDFLGIFRVDSVAQMDKKRREIGFVERSRRIDRTVRTSR